MLVLMACGETRTEAAPQTKTRREAELEEEKQQLVKQLAEEREKTEAQTRYISEATKTINDVQDELNRITEEQEAVTAKAHSIELQAQADRSQRDELFERVKTLQDKLREANAKLDDYQRRAGEQNAQIGELSKTIAGLKTALAAREETIARLRETVEAMKVQVAGLVETVASQQEAIDQGAKANAAQKEEIDSLNAVYYVVDSLRNLRRTGVIRYEGGLFLIGRVPKVNGIADPKQFRKVDKRNQLYLAIPKPCAQVHIVSEHPDGSWTKVPELGNSCGFTVVTPELFWRTTVLVIGVDR